MPSPNFRILTNLLFEVKKAGIKAKIIDERAIVTSLTTQDPASEEGIAIGDIIYEIDGQSIKEIVNSKYPLINASNKMVALREISDLLFQTKNNELNIKFLRDKKSIQLAFLPFR